MIVHSTLQENIFDFIEFGKGNALINAVAGSGKTTTIVEGAKRVPTHIEAIFLAFNKAIVNELELRLPSHVPAQTLHSLGWKAIIASNYPNKVALDPYKYNNVINNLRKAWDEDYMYGLRVKSLVDIIRFNLIPTWELGDSEEVKRAKVLKLEESAKYYQLEVYGSEAERAFEVIDYVKRTIKDKFDYTDMLYIAAIDEKIKMSTYGFIFVDECQDLSTVQQALLKKIMNEDSRLVAVGDPRQAIYGFAGADIESFKKLKSFPNTIELPLSVNYRCGKTIIELAQRITPQIEAFENSPQGEVNYEASVKEIKGGDFILCRNVAPLVKLCMQFLGKGQKAIIRGRDIGASLVNLIKKSKAESLGEFFKFIDEEKQSIYTKLTLKYPDLTDVEIKDNFIYQLFEEKAKVLQLISDSDKNIKTPKQLKYRISDMFSDDLQGIILSTIHRAKGLEAERVFILEKRLMPSKYAKLDWQIDQERNLEYVAYTRAKKYLGFITDWTIKTGTLS